MANHRWKDDSNEFHSKKDVCIKCGIERYWIGGDMQGWEYLDLQSSFGSNRTTFNRPNCEPNRGRTQGFYRDGTYIKNI